MTTNLHGNHLIGTSCSADGSDQFFGFDPATGARLDPPFHEATQGEIDRALAAAVEAQRTWKSVPSATRAGLLEAIATGIEDLGEGLLERASRETGLPLPRLVGERGRTCAQLRMFAAVVREGSWVGASIDHAEPDRAPIPKPDLRRMSIPIGPVVVFGASNFPLAFSVAGGDTASALAAGCPVVVKAHPNHPGTSEMVGEVIRATVAQCGLPEGTFSLVQGASIETGVALVRHPSTKAVGFTGSLAGGRALFDIAAARPDPIPVYAEMGSTNPVFLLPTALDGGGAMDLAAAVQQSVTVGVGQFCTNPGLIVTRKGASTDAFLESLTERMAESPTGTMLHAGIRRSYTVGVERLRQVEGVDERVQGVPAGSTAESGGDEGRCQVKASLLVSDAETWLCNPVLADEVFGPVTLVIQCEGESEMQLVAENLPGQLTASVHGSDVELAASERLLRTIEDVAGRVIVNSFPTGVEVCFSMQHGGPYPATTDSRTTSVGHAAIHRFARPVSYQGMPTELLPDALKDDNPLGLLRVVDGEWTREPTGMS
jgi:2,5-dioxopentanoate dehydrogenase